MATANTFYAQFQAGDGTVTGNRFLGVLGAGWVKTALLANEHAQGQLVQGNQFDQNRFHRIRLSPLLAL